jgi:4,4'-diaponeurosporenoate glycosyltransferase
MVDLVVALALLAVATWVHLQLRALRTVPPGNGRGADAAAVSVVVPARNEADTLPALLDSLHRSGLAVAEILVVDDGSHDGTAAVARRHGARVLSAGPPPPGWTGKAWACHVGSRATGTELLLFLDADTELAPDALSGLLELHERHPGLVSVQPFHRVVRPYEQLSSYFNAVSVLASVAFGRRPPRRPMAFGPCLLTARADYERAGGHAVVRGDILDDVELAAAYHRSGMPVTCAIGGQAIQMRSYPGGFRQLAAGWTKNVASGASAADPRAAAAAVLWVCAHHAVAVGAMLALLEATTGRGAALTHGEPGLWAVAWLALAAQLRVVLRRLGSFRWWTWALFPVPLLVFDLVFARSAALTVVRRSVRWREREVDLRERTTGGELL